MQEPRPVKTIVYYTFPCFGKDALAEHREFETSYVPNDGETVSFEFHDSVSDELFGELEKRGCCDSTTVDLIAKKERCLYLGDTVVVYIKLMAPS